MVEEIVLLIEVVRDGQWEVVVGGILSQEGEGAEKSALMAE